MHLYVKSFRLSSSSEQSTNGQGSGLQHRMLTAFSLLFGPTEHVAALTIH